MSYSSDTIFHFSFDDEPIIDLVAATLLNVTGSTPVIVSGIFDGAWQMADTVYGVSPDTFAPTTALTVGFWLNPVHPGLVTDPSDQSTKPLIMPLFAKATFSVGSTIIATGNTIIAWEETQENGKNVMKMSLRGTDAASPVVATIISSEYDVGVFHHFWIVFNGAEKSLTLFIDTIEDTSASIIGNVPDTLLNNSSSFSINENAVGPLWQVARNSGIIDDFVAFSSAKVSGETITRAANLGVLYVADTSYSDIEEIDQAAIFDDAGTAQITSVHANRGRIYVARSDGKLLRGTKLLWHSFREFSSVREAESLSTANKGDGGSVTVVSGELQIRDKVVRV